MTPAWILDLLAAVMLVVAAVSGARLVAARPWPRGAEAADTDIAHLLMAIAMAGMLTISLATLPAVAWEVVFGVLTAWFAVRVVLDARGAGMRALAGGHCAPHLVHSAAMLYMFLATAAPASAAGGMGGMAGMSSGTGAAMTLDHPTVAFLFALILIAYGVWDLDQLSGRRYHRPVPVPVPAGAGAATLSAPASPAPAAVLLSPAVTVGCRLSMGVVMVFLLIIAI